MNSLLQNRGESILRGVESDPVLKAEVDSTLKYFLLFLVLGFSSALAFSYFFSRFNTLPSGELMLQTSVIGAVFLIILVFQTFFIQSFYFNLVLVLMHTGALLGFYFQPFSAWFLIAGLAFIMCWAFAFYSGRQELAMHLKFNFWRYSTITLVKLISGIALLLAFAYAGFYTRSGAVSYQAYKFTVSGIPGVEYIAPNFVPNTSGLTKELQENVPMANENMLDYTYRLAIQGINYLQAHGLGFLVVVAIVVLIFFSTKGVMFFIQWPLLVICLLIYYGLLAGGVITIETETRQKEVVVRH